jgi:UPF0716 protein FxsA
MSLLFRLFLLFTLVPFVELLILIKIHNWMGLFATLGLVIFTGALGAALARYQGLLTWSRIQRDLSMGIVPSGRLIDGMLILIAGVVLVTPGILTDTAGFLLLIPPVRNAIKQWLRRWFERKIQSGQVEVHIDPFQ